MIREFLDIYETELGRSSVLFEGVETLLESIEADGARWGIITNKPEYLARLVIPQLGWEARCAILLGGDSLPERKPHPLPLLHAASALGASISDCVYVGDDQRDIEAARAAGMRSVVALWGYRGDDERPGEWGGDVMATSVHEMLHDDFWQALR
jgi:phosphoglycolate phosphatase